MSCHVMQDNDLAVDHVDQVALPDYMSDAEYKRIHEQAVADATSKPEVLQCHTCMCSTTAICHTCTCSVTAHVHALMHCAVA